MKIFLPALGLVLSFSLFVFCMGLNPAEYWNYRTAGILIGLGGLGVSAIKLHRRT